MFSVARYESARAGLAQRTIAETGRFLQGSLPMRSGVRVGFGFGNLVAAGLLVAGIGALPVRFWAVDAPLAAVAVALVASSVVLFANLPWAQRALRAAAFALLGLGLFVIALAVLTLVFLAGVHGRWFGGSIQVTALTLALIVPYTVVYPIAQLVAVPADKRGAAA